MQFDWVDARTWLIFAVVMGSAIVAGLLLHSIVLAIAGKVFRRKGSIVGQSITKHIRKPSSFIFPLLAINIALPFVTLPENLLNRIQHGVGLGFLAAIGWGLIVLTEVIGDVMFARYSIEAADNLEARRIRTQTQVLQRVVIVLVVVVTGAVMLMTIPSVRQIGASVLASAGLAGLVVGMAAKPTLSSLVAGLQVALTQPIRIEDAVIVEGEWGWIEEIETTYVVVRIWDLRRLIVPLSYFIEHPFQNWTRTTADLLGTVILYTDYTVPVEEVRQELHRILQGTNLWDGKVWGLQVTDTTEQTVQLRALMSAPNAPQAWDLRCYVREKLIAYLQEKHPTCLPQRRELLLPDSEVKLPGGNGSQPQLLARGDGPGQSGGVTGR
jgi:small-conductance mechanosensitive channel